MRSFKDFNLKAQHRTMLGDKIKIHKILNKEITVHKFKIEASKYKKQEDDKCLHLQIELSGSMHVIFTGSKALMEVIEQIPESDLPFTTTIIQENDRFEFT